MNQMLNLKDVYSNMISGSIPNHAGNIDLSIFMIVRNTLGTDKFHILTIPFGEFAFYLAVPSKNITSDLLFPTELAAAYPSHPNHKGDGVYYLEHETFSVVLIKNKESFRCIANNSETIASFIEDVDLPVYSVNNGLSWNLETIPGRYRRMADALSSSVFKYSSIVAGAASLVVLFAAIGGSVLTAKVNDINTQRSSELNSLLKRIDYTSPLASQMAQLQKISATVVRAGGWIEWYELKNNKETFSLSLPSWVTQDYITDLGIGAVADIDRSNNLVRVGKK